MKEETLREEKPLLADGFDKAILGLSRGSLSILRDNVVVYSVEKCIDILAKDMTYEEAVEYFEYNVLGAYMGPMTPIFVHEMDVEGINEYADTM